MKRILLISMAAASLLVFACNWAGSGTGSLEIPLPDSVLAKDLGQADARAAITTIRVWLESSSGSYIPLGKDSVVFHEEGVSGKTSITINEISPATRCVLYIALGEGTGTNFRPIRFTDASSSFDIVAGSKASVRLRVKDSPFTRLAMLEDAKGVKSAYLDGKYYFLSNSSLYSGTASSSPTLVLANTNATSLSVGKAVSGSSSSFGAAQLWLNTRTGTYPLVDGALGTVIPGSKDSEIYESGVVEAFVKNAKQHVIYFMKPGDVVGALFENGAWKTYGLLSTLQEQSGFADLYNIIKDNRGRLIADLQIVNDANGLASFGYAIPPSPLSAISFSVSLADDLDGAAKPLTWATLQNIIFRQDSLIASGGSIISSLSRGGAFLYVGSDKGVSVAQTSANGKLAGNPALITLPRRAEIVKVRATARDGVSWAAALGKRGNLFIMKDGLCIAEYRFHTGIPGAKDRADETGGLFWSDEGLVVCGIDGIVLLPYAKLGN